MDFWQVFYALQDVFPQIDLLILKSIAIDYSSDVDAAVEFVLNEVLRSISESTETDVVPPNIHHAEHCPSGSGMHEQQNKLGDQRSEEDPNLLPESSISCQNGICNDDSAATDVGSLCMHKAVGRSGLVEDTSALNELEFFYGQEVEVNSDVPLESKDLGCESDLTASVFHSEPISFGELSIGSSFSDLPNQDGVSNEKPKSVVELVDHIVQPHQKLRDSAAPHVADNVIEAEIRRNVSEFCSHIQEFASSTPEINLFGQYGTGAGKHMNGCLREIEDQRSINLFNAENTGQLCKIEADESTLGAFISAENISLPIVENPSHSGKHEARVEKTISNSISMADREQSGCLTESSAEHAVSQMTMSSIGDDHTLGLATQSCQVVQVDYIDEFIYNMTKRKETLTSVFESTIAKLEQVELHEANARQIKEEAAKADQDILSKVKDLGKMIENAKESNNKHAGEVYKERSLLEIEARELQSQLISISSQRDKSLSIIEEINHTLDARLSTAKEEKAAAEQEIVGKKKRAYKVLKQREEDVENLKRVSQRLQIETEESIKLRNLLMDRGRIVDILQGEMSVICENIMSLKERFSGHLPLDKLTPPTTSRTSSTCSVYTKDMLSNGDRHVSSNENPKIINKESSQDQMFESNVDIHKALSDDDWDYIDA